MSKLSSNADCICPVFGTNGKCGEKDTLKVMEQFKDFYEGKLIEVESRAGGNCLEIKLKIQRRWIEDLTEQTHMMARVVKELEDEATSRVRMLEEKLKQTSKNAYEVMKRYQAYSISQNLDENFQKVFYLESDLKNLLEFIRRIRDDKKWSINGLQFYEVSDKDLFGCCECDENEKNDEMITNGLDNNLGRKEISPTEDMGNSNGNDINQTYDQLTQSLKKKTEEYDELRKSMLDMRSALTEEVACKHDMISALRKDVQQLEERCLQSDKQTAFKDDIIKELRKEIKQLKQEKKEKEADCAKPEMTCRSVNTVPLTAEKVCATTSVDQLIQNRNNIIQIQNDTLNVIDLELQATKKREKDLEDEISKRQREVDHLKCKCDELETILESAQGRAENLQKAVDLYINSINVLEASEEKTKIEIEQQKVTIAQLQEALVNVKQELDELRQNSQQEVSVGWAARWFGSAKSNQKSVHDV